MWWVEEGVKRVKKKEAEQKERETRYALGAGGHREEEMTFQATEVE